MFRKIALFSLVSLLPLYSYAGGGGNTIKSVYYCGDDFSMYMSNGERWVIKKAQVGEYKMNHMISIALYMSATGKRTENIFPGAPERWCGNDNTRPITFISFEN